MSRPARRTLALAAIASSVVAFAASPALAGADVVRAEGPLIRHGDGSLVPEGATAKVSAVYTPAGDSRITLRVEGLLPNREYGAHAHVAPCSPTDPLASGGHYQLVQNPDPANPTDPTYANPQNEVWLDLTTDAHGRGVARATLPWQFHPDRRPASVVLHQTHTHHGPPSGGAGTAGPRLACLTVPF